MTTVRCAAAVTIVAACACGDGGTSLSPSPSARIETPSTPLVGCTVSGVVHEAPGGARSGGATVKLVKEPGGYSAAAIVSATTDATGGYRLGGIDCGVGRILRAEKADFFPQEVPIQIAGNEQRDLTIDRVTYLLRGIIRDGASGARVAGATIEVLTGPYAGRTATSHADGSYGVSVRDTVTVRVSKPGYLSQSATVTVSAPALDRDFAL